MADVIEVNCATGEVVTRPMTADELAAQEASAAQAQAEADAKAKAEADMAAKLATVNAKLAAIGLTADDLNTLLAVAKA